METKLLTHSVTKNDTTQPPTIILTIIAQFQYFLVQVFVSEYAIKYWFEFPLHLFNVLILPCTYLTLRNF